MGVRERVFRFQTRVLFEHVGALPAVNAGSTLLTSRVNHSSFRVQSSTVFLFYNF